MRIQKIASNSCPNRSFKGKAEQEIFLSAIKQAGLKKTLHETILKKDLSPFNNCFEKVFTELKSRFSKYKNFVVDYESQKISFDDANGNKIKILTSTQSCGQKSIAYMEKSLDEKANIGILYKAFGLPSKDFVVEEHKLKSVYSKPLIKVDFDRNFLCEYSDEFEKERLVLEKLRLAS